MRLSLHVSVLWCAAACAVEPVAGLECAAAASEALFGATSPDAVANAASLRAAIGTARGGHDSSCTATRVHAEWALTAAHCSGLDAGGSFLPSQPGAEAVPVVARVAHEARDVALLHLAYAAEPGAWFPLVATAPSAGWEGQAVTLAGVGLTERGHAGELAVIETRVAEEDEAWLGVDGDGRRGACLGDSGGPLLWSEPSGPWRVAGVLSRGDASCVGVDRFERTDAIGAWVEQVVVGSAAGACGAAKVRR